MAMIKCPECGRDVSDRAEKCIHCGYPLGGAARQDGPAGAVMDDNGSAAAVPAKNNILRSIIGLVIIAVISYALYYGVTSFTPSYYVAKFPGHSAASVMVDGYMHKSRSCCQKVADTFGAEVIRIKPNQTAGTNSFGQAVQYNDRFYYCPLCCD